MMEQNWPKIRNQRTHIGLEHYDTSLQQKIVFFVDQCNWFQKKQKHVQVYMPISTISR